MLLASRRRATELGLPILATLKSFAVRQRRHLCSIVHFIPTPVRSAQVVGVPPAIMGIGPAVAIPEALQRAKLRTSDIDMYEINEAFASQAVYCVEKLGLDPQKVNPLGGAIALGHPLGCTGARQVRAPLGAFSFLLCQSPPVWLFRSLRWSMRCIAAKPSAVWCRCASARAWARQQLSKRPHRRPAPNFSESWSIRSVTCRS